MKQPNEKPLGFAEGFLLCKTAPMGMTGPKLAVISGEAPLCM